MHTQYVYTTMLGLSCDTLRLHFVCAKRGLEFVCTQI